MHVPQSYHRSSLVSAALDTYRTRQLMCAKPAVGPRQAQLRWRGSSPRSRQMMQTASGGAAGTGGGAGAAAAMM